MDQCFMPALIFLAVTHCMAINNGTQCGQEYSPRNRVSISVISKKRESDQWVTSFTTSKDEPTAKLASNITFDLSHEVMECDEQRTIIISGVIGGSLSDTPRISNESDPDRLIFHSKCGTNVEILNNGRTIKKINLDDPLNSLAFTNRPLKDNELFEAKLEQKNNKFRLSLGIGVTIHSPTDVVFPSHMNNLKGPLWIMFHSHIYHNGVFHKQNYGKDLNALVVGDRVGVMRTDKGNIHFYVNGVDQGLAASNVPSPLYGMLELWNDAAKASIVS